MDKSSEGCQKVKTPMDKLSEGCQTVKKQQFTLVHKLATRYPTLLQLLWCWRTALGSQTSFKKETECLPLKIANRL